jgi:hypothetical protein
MMANSHEMAIRSTSLVPAFKFCFFINCLVFGNAYTKRVPKLLCFLYLIDYQLHNNNKRGL